MPDVLARSCRKPPTEDTVKRAAQMFGRLFLKLRLNGSERRRIAACHSACESGKPTGIRHFIVIEKNDMRTTGLGYAAIAGSRNAGLRFMDITNEIGRGRQN